MPTAPPSDRHIAAARKRLGQLAGISGKTHATELAILKAAEERMAVVQTDLAKLRTRALTDDTAGQHFAELTKEKGQIALVIAQSRQATSA